MKYPGIMPADIYLPRGQDNSIWAVIACDQYTSQPQYWQEVEKLVGGAPSTFRLIQPECAAVKRSGAEISTAMGEYLARGILTKQVSDGFVVCERRTPSGARAGLICAVDLEEYDFAPGNQRLIRATEGTVIERLPPRIEIRAAAPLELPHVMLLIDDPLCTVIEPLYAACAQSAPLYDFELMQGGGHLRGWGISGEQPGLAAALEALRVKNEGFLYAVGDGNHSLAAAKAVYERLGAKHRRALVEIVNLHCPALRFEPIHRLMFDVEKDAAIKDFGLFLSARGMSLAQGEELRFVDRRGENGFDILGAGGMLPVALVQQWLDEAGLAPRTDYIHGEDNLRQIILSGRASGILLGAMDKSALFPTVRARGVLPRKAFSMGEADEKRFYMEAARLI